MLAGRPDVRHAALSDEEQRLHKLESLLEVLHDLLLLEGALDGVPVRGPLSRHEFLTAYYARNRPVLLRGLVDGWQARWRWNPAYLRAVCGEVTVEIMTGREANRRYEVYPRRHRRAILFKDYVDMVLSSGATNDHYLVASNDFLQRPAVSRLWEDMAVLPEYLDESRKIPGASLWFGPAGTVTPLHHDIMNILLVQVYGRKRIILIPPSQSHLVYNDIGMFSEVDAEQPDLDQYPRFAQTTPLSLDLHPGDSLFLPVGWWHHVRSLDVAISVSFTNFVFPNDYRWRHPRIDRDAPPESQPVGWGEPARGLADG